MKKLLPLLFVMLVLAGCRVSSELSQQDLNALYDPATRFTSIEGQAVHLNDSTTWLRLYLKLSDFSYEKTRAKPLPMARIMIHYRLTDNYETNIILHRDSVYLTDSIYLNPENIAHHDLYLPIKTQGEFLFSANITDLNNKKEASFFLVINKGDMNFRENFNLSDEDGQPLFGDRIAEEQAFNIKSLVNEGPLLFGRFYQRQFPIALPPFAIDNTEPFDYDADSTFKLDYQKGNSGLLKLNKKGFYHFQTDTTNKHGITVFVTDPDFPRISLPLHVLEPLRYITTTREFEQLSTYQNPKLAVDSFWLAHAGLESRAKTLISKYYNRVQEANTLFSSYLEGWKTDRGMIYIIFGPPNHVFRATNIENWTYGEVSRPQSLRFSFVRVNNPFTNNDFSLMRNPQYKEFWFNSVEVWRR